MLGLPETPGEPLTPLVQTGQCDAGGKLVCNPELLRRDPRLCNYDAHGTAMSAVGREGRFQGLEKLESWLREIPPT